MREVKSDFFSDFFNAKIKTKYMREVISDFFSDFYTAQ